MKKNIDTNIDDRVKQIMYKSNYKINESARFKQLVDIEEDFDEVPEEVLEADEVEKKPEVPENLPPDLNAPPTDNPELAQNMEQPINNELPVPEVPVEDTDTLQNDIIKQNIETMKSINDKIDNLAINVDGLNNKLNDLSKDVEEVREPTNGEKLLNKKASSLPYYYNLNDIWKDNWFDQKHQNGTTEDGIKQLPDGTFVADFDDLPKNYNIEKSFND